MSSSYSILVVEDNEFIREGLEDALTMSGYVVLSAKDGREASCLIREEVFDLALLDVVLPERDGVSLLKQIRAESPTVPVIMVTAKGEEKDKVYCFKLGADDYVVKPFGIPELMARIEAVLRRSPERPRILRRFELNEGYVDSETRMVILKDRTISLTPKEYELIRHLASHSGRIVSREEILTRVWKMDPKLVETRSIDTTLAHLREKLGKANAGMIKTLREQGYRWIENEK